MEYQEFLTVVQQFLESNDHKSIEDKTIVINKLREVIHSYSPFKNEPVDCVLWVKNENVVANDYNPNRVAPPEMKLLEISIANDGFTQPVVTFPENNKHTVIDGFHRTRISKECPVIQEKVFGYTPITVIRNEQSGRNDRIASTIRHNRARGRHIVDAMSEIVLELKNRNWKNERIARELGMDEEEILRLCQITGLEELFQDDDFSKSWNIGDSEPDLFEPLTDQVTDEEKQDNEFRTINTSDENRIFHTYDKWECFNNGFFNTHKSGMTKDQCEKEYALFLSDEKQFREALKYIIENWTNSCEHYLTNKSMNRIAWLGQASLCYAKGIPSIFRSGFNLLPEEQQNKANLIAFEYLNKWLRERKLPEATFEEALAVGRQSEIY
jgi:hypothetical protein